MNVEKNNRILIVDDNASIHEDFHKILISKSPSSAPLADAKAAFFGSVPAAAEASSATCFQIDDAHQGLEACGMLEKAALNKTPYALAFVDVRMPPGLDGIETTARLMKLDPRLQIVICTAFSDYSWEALGQKLGTSDRVLILKKPFDPVEVVQLARALTEKWNSSLREELRLADVVRAEQEARSYAASLSITNRALETSKASAEAASRTKSEFLARLGRLLSGASRALSDQARHVAAPQSDEAQRHERLLRLDLGLEQLCATAASLQQLARLELGTLETRELPFSPGQLLHARAEHWKPRIEAAGLCFHAHCDGLIPLIMIGDAEHIGDVLDTLLDNALRFTKHGDVRLVMAMPATEEGCDAEIAFSVEDSGAGIRDELHGRVFEPLAGSEEEATLGQGMHLSLAIARRIVRQIGGELTLESGPNSGARFTLRIPVGARAELELGAYPAPALPSRDSGVENNARDATPSREQTTK